MALMHFLSDTNVTFKDLLRNSMALRLMARTHWVFGANVFAAIATGTAFLQSLCFCIQYFKSYWCGH